MKTLPPSLTSFRLRSELRRTRRRTSPAAGLLSVAGVGSVATARCGDAGAREEAPSQPATPPRRKTARDRL
jgi:hypothetical protein